MDNLFAKTIYTGKKVISNAYLQFSGKTISGISTSKKGRPIGKYEVLTPAFIDPHSHIGMERAGEPNTEGEANEHQEKIL